jgi:hypothetical protein
MSRATAMDGKIPIVNASVTIIKSIATGLAPKRCVLATATGFFYEFKGRRFLLTNRHVVIDEKTDFYPDKLIALIHTSNQKSGPCRDVTIPLYEGQRPLWIEHPDSLEKDEKIDVVALQISEHISDSDFITFWSSSNFLPDDVTVPEGTRLNIMGYPRGFYDTTNNLPVTRSGGLASPFGAFFEGKPLFLVDANLHPGDSGSPVILSGRELEAPLSPTVPQNSFSAYLLGVNSGGYSDLRLNAVWYADVIPDMLGDEASYETPTEKQKDTQ